MRTFLALTIVLCIAGGLYLLQGPDFYWPARGDPSQAIFLSGHGSRLLGASLLLIGALGVMLVRQAGQSRGRAASPRWQISYFLLTMVAIALLGTAAWLGDVMPNPESRQATIPRDATPRTTP